MENGAGLGIAGGAAGAKGLADLIVEKLQDEKLTAEIVDAELIANRFAPEAQAVDPTGKVSVVWGQLKSVR